MVILKTAQIRGVIYDCDGVLLDSLEANRRFYSHLCEAAGRAPLTEEDLRYVFCHTLSEAVLFLFRNRPDLEERVRNLLGRMDPMTYIEHMKMEPHVIETLEELKRRGILRALNTSRAGSLKLIFDRFGLSRHFDLIVTSLDIRHPKPHPESIEKILKTLHLSPAEALYVGDSVVDRQAADGTGVRFIAYKNREIANGLLIEDHLDLLDLLS
jgi:phosphoglycolate phosphatase